MSTTHRTTTLTRLVARLEELELEVATLRAERAPGPPPLPSGVAATAAPVPEPTERASRRSLLRTALGVAAATVGAAALVETTAGTAAANDGAAVTAGAITTAEHRTAVKYDGAAGFHGVVLLGNDSTYSGNTANYPAAAGGFAGAGSTAGTGGVANGVYGYTDNGNGNGVVGYNSDAVNGAGAGVLGLAFGAAGVGVRGTNSQGTGVSGTSAAATGTGVSGSGYTGVSGTSTSKASGTGVSGVSNSATGGIGVGGECANNIGVYGTGYTGVLGYGTTWAGYFDGNVDVVGTVSKSGGSFKIDHPLQPSDKYLYHSFVESPDMKNIYDGVVTLDVHGQAEVSLPAWFDALNSDVRYQLTPIGAPSAGLHVAAEMRANRFTIAGGTPGLKVCWLVTGIRQDAWANAHRIPVEVDKPADERGYYLHPDLIGAPAERSIAARHRPPSRLYSAPRSPQAPHQVTPDPNPTRRRATQWPTNRASK